MNQTLLPNEECDLRGGFDKMSGDDDVSFRIRARVVVYMIIIVVSLSVIIGRLWYLQVISHDIYDEMSRDNRTRILPLDAPRGLIRDRNGEVLADSRTAYAVSLVPQNIRDSAEVIEKLSEILGVSEQEIEDRISDQKTRPFVPVRIKSDISTEVVVGIEERRLELPGVIVEEISVRYYPHGNVASLLLGNIGPASSADIKRLTGNEYREGDIIGKTGIEYAYEIELKGIDGKKEVEVDAYSWPIRTLGYTPPKPDETTLSPSTTSVSRFIPLKVIRVPESTFPSAMIKSLDR